MRKMLIFGLLLAFLFTSGIVAADYPEENVEIICPWGSGGGTDQLARFMAEELEEEFGGEHSFSVVNKTGGGGAVGHGEGAYAKPDGHTITLVTLEIASMHWMGKTPLDYDDFEFVIQLNQDPAGVIVRDDAPYDNINDLIDDVKEDPGSFQFSGSGAGTIWDLARVGMLDEAGIDPNDVKWVPTDGAAPSIKELLGEHVDVITCSVPEAQSQLESGELKALGVMGDERLDQYPDIPTLKEQGLDWSAGTWRGLAVPKGTPDEVVNELYEKALEITETEEYKEFMSETGFGIKIRDPQEFHEFVKEEDKIWKDVIEMGGYSE